MAQFFEFVGNHPVLSGLWLLLVVVIVVRSRAGASKTVGPQQAVMLINRSDAVVVDIRDKKDFDAGHIVESINIPLTKLAQRITELDKYKEKPVVVVCRLGHQSSDASASLQKAGFNQVFRLSGGITEWKAQSLPLVQK